MNRASDSKDSKAKDSKARKATEVASHRVKDRPLADNGLIVER